VPADAVFHVTLELKEMFTPGHTVVGVAVNETGDGGLLTVIYPVLVIVLLPDELVTCRLTVYVPGTVYDTTGFCIVEVDGVTPVPENVQLQLEGLPVERSVKLTTMGGQPVSGEAEKLAEG
jgi:hypothetical protein